MLRLRRIAAVIRSRGSRWTSSVSFLAAAEGRFESLRRRYEELCALTSEGTLSPAEAREVSAAEELLGLRREYEALRREAGELASMAAEEADEDVRREARAELDGEVRPRLEALEGELVSKLLPKEDGEESRRALVEVRAAAGGDEASMFARDLVSMYSRFASARGWRWETLEESKTESGGVKESFAVVEGEGVYAELKFESGVHRVQRVPANDNRIHTSTATVVVLPHAVSEATPVTLPPGDLRIDTFRATGAGGQHVNTTDSAVRVTHLPTGIVVTNQDERSQHKNKAKALRILAARIHAAKAAAVDADRSSKRAALAGSGDRSERVRTYNYPHDRVVDHRIAHTATSVDRVLSGDLLHDILRLLAARDRDLRIHDFHNELLASDLGGPPAAADTTVVKAAAATSGAA
mmetsp:Transcript_9861/g.31667  ORF Transcript_9861/g.31667 Transcript_9861/m.31667 type:complete len:410 (-) Transcript_9861:69-1298(-)